MSPATWIAFLAGGAVGAPLRYVVDGFVSDRTGGRFPWGTLLINVTGSIVLGALTGLALHHGLDPAAKTVLGTGFCGAFTTFSTFTYETVRLVEEGAVRAAVVNVVANTVVASAAAGAALAIALR